MPPKDEAPAIPAPVPKPLLNLLRAAAFLTADAAALVSAAAALLASPASFWYAWMFQQLGFDYLGKPLLNDW